METLSKAELKALGKLANKFAKRENKLNPSDRDASYCGLLVGEDGNMELVYSTDDWNNLRYTFIEINHKDLMAQDSYFAPKEKAEKERKKSVKVAAVRSKRKKERQAEKRDIKEYERLKEKFGN